MSRSMITILVVLVIKGMMGVVFEKETEGTVMYTSGTDVCGCTKDSEVVSCISTDILEVLEINVSNCN